MIYDLPARRPDQNSSGFNIAAIQGLYELDLDSVDNIHTVATHFCIVMRLWRTLCMWAFDYEQ